MANPLKIAPPPPRRPAVEAAPDSAPAPEPTPVVAAARQCQWQRERRPKSPAYR